MARGQKPPIEFRFMIDAFTPRTIPLLRLAEYMQDFAVLLGNEKSVHPGDRLEEGSTTVVARVEWEAEPKVRERLRSVRNKDGNDRVMEAAARLDDRLAEDNAKGASGPSSSSPHVVSTSHLLTPPRMRVIFDQGTPVPNRCTRRLPSPTALRNAPCAACIFDNH
jgi:hypothetical protein